MVPLAARYPVVMTSNSGFPLDQNLYQTVKGMSAASRVVEDGGTIVMVSECRDGFPDHGDFRALLNKVDSPAAAERFVQDLEALMLDQWRIQIMVGSLRRARVMLYSEMAGDAVGEALLTPTDDLQACVEEAIRGCGEGCRVAVMPDGPLTIPYLAGQVFLLREPACEVRHGAHFRCVGF